ncbi:MAG: ATP-binding protein [bacterium]
MNEKIADCPITGLSIIVKPEWTNLKVSKNYTVTFQLIGDRILLAKAEGNMNNYDQKKYYKLREKVIKDAFGDKSFVEMKDYSGLTGIPNRKQRLLQSNQIEKEKKRLLGYFPFNATFFVKTIFSVGIIGRKIPFPMKVLTNYETAIHHAMNVLTKNNMGTSFDKSFSGHPFIKKSEWSYSSEKFSVEFKVVPDKILYYKVEGSFSKSHIPGISETLDKIFQDGFFKAPFYCEIGDLTELHSISFDAYKEYISMVETIHRQFNVKIRKSFVINALFSVRAMLFFVSSKLDYQYSFVNSVEKALEQITAITAPPTQNENSENVHIAVKDIESIVRYMGTIAWENLDERKPQIDADNPLRIILDAVELVKSDFYSLLNEMSEKNRELLLERKKTQKISEIKSKYLSTISHEIRNPLNSIKGFSELLEQTPLSDKQQEYIENINFSSETLMTTINDILDLSKIESGRITVEHIAVDIRKLIHKTTEMLQFEARKKNIFLRHSVDENLPRYFVTDPVKLRQIMLNLIGNALKFTHEGGVELSVKTKEDPEKIKDGEQTHFIFAVKDTGIGISEQMKKKIFFPFTQAGTSTKRKYGGTGLGLTISKSLVEKLDGKIKVESEEGNGSVFSFELDLETHREKPESLSLLRNIS